MSDSVIVKQEDKFNLQFSFTCTIDNFSNLPSAIGEHVRSKCFSGTGKVLDEWYILCYPGGKDESCAGHVSLMICSQVDVIAEISMSIKGIALIKNDFGRQYYRANEPKGIGNFVLRQELLMNTEIFLPENRLSVVCEISILTEFCFLSLLVLSKMEKDFDKLNKNPIFSDLTIVAEGEEMHTHRNILAARSNVFSKMLCTGLQEGATNRIVIEDASRDAVKEMLQYLYTSRYPGIGKHSHELFYLADKYQLNELKALCEVTLAYNLSFTNCLDTLLLAIRFKSENLKLPTMDFIINNIEEVRKTDRWSAVMTSNGALIDEVYAHHLNKLQGNKLTKH